MASKASSAPMYRLNVLRVAGYRPFRQLNAPLGPLEVIVGANGTGKSSLFEFLRFLRNAAHSEIPPEIVEGAIGQQIFHRGEADRFSWELEIDTDRSIPLIYSGELMGPVGETRVTRESVKTKYPLSNEYDDPFVFMDITNRKGVVNEPGEGLKRQAFELQRPNQLALSAMTNPKLGALYQFREYVRGWRFYDSFRIDNAAIRRSVPIEQDPVLREDASNLSAVLFHLMTEHSQAFEELQTHLRGIIPGFKQIRVKARGGPGEVMAFWSEHGVNSELALSDLSDGILRLVCWVTLAVQPTPPPLVCIDEPGQGVHPRTLDTLAALFQRLAERTQVVLATHSSYFLSRFDIDQVAVMRKEQGASQFLKPNRSDVLMHMLENFGTDELEALHRSDELEQLPETVS